MLHGICGDRHILYPGKYLLDPNIFAIDKKVYSDGLMLQHKNNNRPTKKQSILLDVVADTRTLYYNSLYYKPKYWVNSTLTIIDVSKYNMPTSSV